MSRIRQQNVTAAQWSANGGALGSPDLTVPGNEVFGANVFSTDVQRARLPKHVFKALQTSLAEGKALDTALADSVAQAMKGWALERGATHYTHWFQPLTGMTAEKHDSFFGPTGDGNAIAEFSGKELIQGEPDASSFPTGGIRATFEARGYTAWDPTSPAFILENPNGALLCIPTAFVSWTGEALDTKIPLLRSMDALSKSAIRALRLLGDEEATRVFTTVGPEQEYFLIDEQYYYERPDLLTTGRTLFGAKPPKGHELDEHYFGSIPERILAYMMETERELAKLGVPVKTRHNEVAPNQYELAPIFENSNVACDHQQLTMQLLQNTARRYGLVCLLHEKPFAGVNGSGKHNNWSMGTDTGANLLEPGDTPSENIQFLFFCAAVVAGRQQAPGAAAGVGRQHRPGPPPRRQRGAAGDHLDLPRRRAREGLRRDRRRRGRGGVRQRLPRPRHARPAAAAAARRRPQPDLAVRLHRQQVRVPHARLELVARLPQHRAQHDRRRGDRRARRRAGGQARRRARRSTRRSSTVVKDAYNANKQIVFGGDNYAEEWHTEAEERGLYNLRSTVDALPWFVDEQTVEVMGKYGVLSERELEARYEVGVEQYGTKVNIEAETAASIARTMLLPAAVRHLNELHRLGPRGPDRRVRPARSRSSTRRSWRSRRPTRTRAWRAWSSPSTSATRCSPRWPTSARSPTGSSGSSPTTCGRCRSTPRCCSSSSARRQSHAARKPRSAGLPSFWPPLSTAP